MIFMFSLLTDAPGNVTDISISTITACSIVVQWSRSSSDPVCGTVWYTVTISSEGGVMIITDNTTMTSYDVTGLNDNTVYHVSVTASNNAGSSSSVTMITMTNSNGKCIRTLTGSYKVSLKCRSTSLAIFVYNLQFSNCGFCFIIFQ